jgi:hypothetical protein
MSERGDRKGTVDGNDGFGFEFEWQAPIQVFKTQLCYSGFFVNF